MKKIFYSLSILLLGAVACTEDLTLTSPEEGQDTVVFDMSVTLPEAVVTTRGACQDNPVIDHIYVATFGNSGYLNEYVKAVPISGIGGTVTSSYASTNGTTYYFRVALLATTSNRYVHIIANGPTQFTYQTQDKDILLETLVTSGNDGAYWQYFQLPNGTAQWSTSSGNWTASQDAINKFRNVKLIRNFARISVRSAASNFTLEKFYVCRTMKDGSITMPALSSFDAEGNKVLDNQGNKIPGTADQVSGTRDGFMNALDYSLAGENTNPVEYVKNTLKYDGYMPTTDRLSPTATASLVDNGYGPTQSQYVYESTDINRHSDNFPFILLKGKYNDGTEHASSYYKIELTDEDGNLIPIYRNFDYTITITRVSVNGVAANEVSNDMITSNANVSVAVGSDMSDVSDGVSGLYVLYTEKTYANAKKDNNGDPVNMPVEFKYKYVPDLNNEGTVKTCELSIVGIAKDTDGETELAGHAIANTTGTWYTQSSTADSDGWYTVTLNVLPSTTYTKLAGTTFKVLGKTTQTINGTTQEYKLFREVTVKLIPVQTFTKATAPGTGTTKNTSVNITLGLPPELPQSVFPLNITVRDSALALNPDNDNEMPLTIDNSKTNPYHFTRTVTWSEYNPTTGSDISCNMHLIQDITTTTITIENEYFNTKTLTYPAQ